RVDRAFLSRVLACPSHDDAQLFVLLFHLSQRGGGVLHFAQVGLQRRQQRARLAQLGQAFLTLHHFAFESGLLGGQRPHRCLTRALERQELVLLLRCPLQVTPHAIQL